MNGPALARKRDDLTTAVWGNYDMQHLQSALGVVALIAFAWAISENRRAVDWKSVGAALLVTLATALLLLEVPQIKTAFASPTARSMPSPRRPRPAPASCSAMSAAARCPSR